MSREQIITQLMEEHYDKIYQCLMNDARRLGAGPLLTETEDCIQEALLLLYDQWPKYETTENLPGWLYITALNTLINALVASAASEEAPASTAELVINQFAIDMTCDYSAVPEITVPEEALAAEESGEAQSLEDAAAAVESVLESETTVESES